MLFLILGITKRHMVYSFFSIIIIFFSLAIIRDSDAFFSCPARIETLFVVSSASILNSAKAVDRFSAVFLASAKSLI